MINPYQPSIIPGKQREEQLFVRAARVFCLILALTLFGYSIPILLIGIIRVICGFPIAEYFDSLVSIHRHFDAASLAPSFGCALLFFLSSIALFIPKHGERFMRSLINTGAAIFLGLFLSGIASAVFGLARRSYVDEPHLLAIRLAIGVFPVIALTLFTVFRQSRE